MQTYEPKENALVPYVFPEIIDILKSPIEIPSWDTRHEIMNSFRMETINWLGNGSITKLKNLSRFKNAYIL